MFVLQFNFDNSIIIAKNFNFNNRDVQIRKPNSSYFILVLFT